MATIISNSANETEQLGERVAKALKGKEVIALFGGLGMGKTAFTRYHFDMYRVQTWDDLYSTGFFDYIGNGVLVIEWSENIEGALPDDAVRVNIQRGAHDEQRIFTIEGIDL